MPKQMMLRDPRILRTLVAQRPAKPLAVGLDLATSTGLSFAWFDPEKPVVPEELQLWMGQLDLSTDKYESGALRFVRFTQFLRELNPSIVFFEDVKYTAAQGVTPRTIAQVMARTYPTAEFIGALKGLLCAYCEEHNVPCAGLPIGSIKRRATGVGNCNKEQMIVACNDTFGTDLDPATYATTGADNVADSAWVLLLGLEGYGRGVPDAACRVT